MGRLTGSFTFAAEYSLTCVGSTAAGRFTAHNGRLALGTKFYRVYSAKHAACINVLGGGFCLSSEYQIVL